MKIFRLSNCPQQLIFAILLTVGTTASANSYLGFNLCYDNEEAVQKTISDAGGDSKNYPIAAEKYEIETFFYESKLVEVKVKNPRNLSPLLKEKYGNPKQTKVRDGGYDFYFDEYKDSNNNNIKIEEIWGVNRNFVATVSLTYTCISLALKKENDEKLKKAEEFKEKNTGKKI